MEVTLSATCCSCPAQPRAEGFLGQTGLKRPFPSHLFLLPTAAWKLPGIEGEKQHMGQP